MNARFKKETRELLPVFVITLVLVESPFLFGGPLAEMLAVLALALGAAALGGTSFGGEFQRRTFSMLLTQPVARAVVWKEKMLVLGGALALVWGWAFVLNMWLFRSKDLNTAILFLIPVCAFCGAPLLTLLVRNGIAGAVFAMALPGVLVACLAGVAPRNLFVGQTAENLIIATLLIYCCAAYWLGRRVFKTAQATDEVSAEWALPPGLERLFARVHWPRFGGPTGTMVALLRKELRLQQMGFVVAGIFVLVALAGALLWRVRPANTEWAEWIIGADFTIYVAILPLLVGAVAFAEERGWGMSEWHLTLPPSAFKQWAAKLMMVVPASLLLGAILPGGLLLAGQALMGQRSVGLASLKPLVWLICLSQLLAMSAAAYAGSLSSSTMKAMIVALGILVTGVLAATLAFTVMPLFFSVGLAFFEDPVRPSWRFVIRGLFLLLSLLLWFSCQNFRRGDGGLKRLVLQSIAAMGVLALLVAHYRLRYYI